MISYSIRTIGDDILVESTSHLTQEDMQQIAATLPEQDRDRVIGWRKIAPGAIR